MPEDHGEGPVSRPIFQFKFGIVIVPILSLILSGAVTCQAQPEQAPPKELLEFVRGARQQGESDAKIEKQAAAVGWPEGVVRQALALAANQKAVPASPMAPKEITASTETASPASFAMPEKDPLVAVAGAANRTAPATPTTTVPRIAPDDYLIGAGDTLSVSVWQDAELSVPTQVVRPDGKITMPLIKEIGVAGLTERQAETAIGNALGKYKTDAIVTVVVTLPTSKKVYMVGAVRKEGTIPYTYGMTVMQAIAEAGGVNDYAKKTKIYVLRTENGREYRLEFNYKEALKGERFEQNVVLQPGDTVVVPQ